MTRYVYNHLTKKEVKTVKHYQLNEKYWIMGKYMKPQQIAFKDAHEDYLLFKTPKACIQYFEE